MSSKHDEELSAMDVSKFSSPSDKLVIDHTLESSGIDKNENNDQNNTSAKEQFWRIFFGDVPMPTPKSDTAKRGSGILGHGMDLNYDIVEESIEQLDQ